MSPRSGSSPRHSESTRALRRLRATARTLTRTAYEHRSVAVSSNPHPDGAVISWKVPEFPSSRTRWGATAKLPTLRQKLR
jgi:hypothetical protein